jgi:hypothetical protein
MQRSITFHGSAKAAERYRHELALEYQKRRAATRAAPMLTVAELLERVARRRSPMAAVDVDRLSLQRSPPGG